MEAPQFAPLRLNDRYTRIRHLVCNDWSLYVMVQMFTTMQKNRAKLWQYGKKTAGFDVRAHHVDVFFTPSLRKNGKKTYDSFWYSDIL